MTVDDKNITLSGSFQCVYVDIIHMTIITLKWEGKRNKNKGDW